MGKNFGVTDHNPPRMINLGRVGVSFVSRIQGLIRAEFSCHKRCVCSVEFGAGEVYSEASVWQKGPSCSITILGAPWGYLCDGWFVFQANN